MKLLHDVATLTKLLLDIFGYEGKSREGIRALNLRLEQDHAPVINIEYVKFDMDFDDERTVTDNG